MTIKNLLLTVLLALAFGARAEEEAPLGPEEWPTTVEATVEDLLKHMPESARKELAAMSEKDLPLTHFGIGLYIRNHYGLWRGNKELVRDACGEPVCHPDDASGKIVEALWKRLRAEG